jgi:hypothetical protein
MGDHPLDHGPAGDRQHLLGRGQGQRSEAGPLPSHQYDSFHRFVVVVVAAVVGVVVPDAGAVEAGAVEAGVDVAGVEAGGAVVVVVAGTTFCRLAITFWGGGGILAPLGMNAMVTMMLS